jgi:hypothetical protein
MAWNPWHAAASVALVLFAATAAFTTSDVRAQQGANQNCYVGKPCGEGLTCIPGRQKCHRNSGALDGEACQARYGCASGLTCSTGSDPVCVVEVRPMQQQCVYSQGGYVAQVHWFAEGTLTSSKTGDKTKVSATNPAFKTETLAIGQKSCVESESGKSSAALTIKGGRYSGYVADASLVPSSKEIFAVVQPPANAADKRLWTIMYGTVFQPKTKTGSP